MKKTNPWDDETDARCFLRVEDITTTHTRTETSHFNPISKKVINRGDYGTRTAKITFEGVHGPLELEIPVDVANKLIAYFDRPKKHKEQNLPPVIIDPNVRFSDG